jgi:Sjoegren syndrome nuclear autoantigen 1
MLSERLAKVNESLTRKILAQNEFDRTIAETEQAYMKVRVKLSFVVAHIV